jgi:hypothetical protein
MGVTRNIHALIFLGVISLGVFLRLIGLDFGLPHLYHADEPIVVNHALAYGSGDLNPHFFKIPPLVSYLLFLCYGLYFLVGALFGAFGSVADFERLFFSDPSSFYLLGRFIFGASCGVATIWALHQLARRFYSDSHALIVSFFLATNFLHVRDSHFVYVDIPLILILVLALHQILTICEMKKRSDLYVFGLLLGTAAAVKYNGVFIVAPFLVGYVMCYGVKDLLLNRNVHVTGLISAIVFFVLNPFALLDFQNFTRELTAQAGSEGSTGMLHHIKYSLTGGMGAPLLITSVLGMVLGFVRKNTTAITLGAFVIPYYVVLCLFSQPYDRYALPLIPVLLLFSSDFIVTACKKLNASKIMIACVTLLIASPTVVKSYLSSQILQQADIRTVAKNWVEENLKEGSRIGLDVKFFTPELTPAANQLMSKREDVDRSTSTSEAQLRRLEHLIQIGETEKRRHFHLQYLTDDPSAEQFLFSKPAIRKDIEELKAAQIDFVIIAKHDKDRNAVFFDDLASSGTLIKRFSPYKDKNLQWPIDHQPLTGAPFTWSEIHARERNGHIIEIYELA